MDAQNFKKTGFWWKIRPIRLNKLVLNSLFLSALLIVIFISWFSFYQLKTLFELNRWVVHTYKVIQKVDKSLFLLREIEANEISYFITGDSLYLKHNEIRYPELEDNLNHLLALTADYPEQSNRTLLLKKLMDERLILLGKIPQLKAQKGFNTLEALNIMHQNTQLAQEIKSIGEEIEAIEQVLLRERSNQVLKQRKSASSIIIFGSIISLIFLTIPFTLANFELINRTIIEHKSRKTREHLKQIIERTSDGIAALDEKFRFQTFNQYYQQIFQTLFKQSLYTDMSLSDISVTENSPSSSLEKNWLSSINKHNNLSTIELFYENQLITLELESNQLINDKNEKIGVVHTIRDITNHIREQRALKDSYQQLESSLKALELKNQQITMLVDLSDMMLAANSQHELSKVMAKYAQNLLVFSSGYIYVMHPSKNYLEQICAWGNPTAQEKIFDPDECWAIRLGRPHRLDNIQTGLICDHLQLFDETSPSILCVPLMAQKDIYGLLYMELSENDKQITQEQQLVITAFTELTALAMANVRLRENLRYQSIRDPMTGLYNRRYLEDALIKQKDRALHEHTHFALFMLDLDHFKKINDTYGHDAGDAALKEVGEVLKNNVRPDDIASRYGGEEFIVVLSKVNLSQAKDKAQEICNAVAKLHVKFGAQSIGPITLSIGFAMFPDDRTETEELIEAADKALYYAKKNGRNQVIAFSEIHQLTS